MRIERQAQRHGYFLLITLGAIVVAFMGLSLSITATGTARFAVAMGYRPEAGYAVGAVFDIAKAVLPVGLLVLVAIVGSAWLGLVTYSALATHATVSSAIASIERAGTWKMEIRSGTKGELDAIEKRLEVLSQPAPPRPIKSIVEALKAEKVPSGVWRDSQECQSIHESRYFQTACAKVLELRRELAAAQDYEQLEVRVQELREALAAAPIVATSDPLPEAFGATIGRLLPLDGRVGVALLLTAVIEIMSCFGLAALRALREEPAREIDTNDVIAAQADSFLRRPSGTTACAPTVGADIIIPNAPSQIVPRSSLRAAKAGFITGAPPTRDDQAKHLSNIVPMPKSKRREAGAGEVSTVSPCLARTGSHVPEFARDRLKPAAGTSLSAAELRDAYEAWCAERSQAPLSLQKLGAELTGFGFAKWKSCGLIRYRDLQLVA